MSKSNFVGLMKVSEVKEFHNNVEGTRYQMKGSEDIYFNSSDVNQSIGEENFKQLQCDIVTCLIPEIFVSVYKRKVAYENEMCRATGLRATWNCCDRIIFEDENYMNEYSENGGYCKDCDNERNN